MSRRMMVIAAVLMGLALLPFILLPVYQYFTNQAVSAALLARTKALVEKNPDLKPDWDTAMQDGVLTLQEAKAIVEKAGEKIEPGE